MGGMATKIKYGREHYSSMGKRGGKSKFAKYGKEYFIKLSLLGVAARLKKISDKKALDQ